MNHQNSPQYGGDHSLRLSVIYKDEHLIEVEARLRTEEWAGLTRTYIGRNTDELRLVASQLATFNEIPAGEVSFEAGHGDNLISLRFFAYGGVRRLACQVRLEHGDMDTARQTQSIKKLDVEVKTESSFLTRFVEELMRLVETQTGSATLVLE